MEILTEIPTPNVTYIIKTQGNVPYKCTLFCLSQKYIPRKIILYLVGNSILKDCCMEIAASLIDVTFSQIENDNNCFQLENFITL
jgi:hypothetical protein